VSHPHPIEEESLRLVGEGADLSRFDTVESSVVARVIHATADVDYAETMLFDEGAIEAGLDALRSHAPVVTDAEMVRCGLTSLPARCYLGSARAGPDGFPTRSAVAMRMAAREHPRDAIVVVGCAPTALEEVLDLVESGKLDPALVVGLPVGFVGAAKAKERARRSSALTITNVGVKGGSAAAAAVVNSLARRVRAEEPW
jgi:precorrin isomerase